MPTKISLHIALVCISFFAGVFVQPLIQKRTPEMSGFLLFNPNAPLAQVEGRSVTFNELPTDSQLEINKEILHLSETLKKNAKYQAALSFELKSKSWQDALQEKLSEQALKAAYDSMPSLKSAGPFSEVKWDVERYLTSKERSMISERFFEGKNKLGTFKYVEISLPSAAFDLSATEFPDVVVGDLSGKETQLTMLLQYAGNSHLNQLSQLDTLAKSAGLRLKLRLVSEYTPHPYNQRATQLLLCATQRSLPAEVLLKLHELLVQEAPRSYWFNKARGEVGSLEGKLGTVDSQLQSCELQQSGLEKSEALSKKIALFRTDKAPLFVHDSQIHLNHESAINSIKSLMVRGY